MDNYLDALQLGSYTVVVAAGFGTAVVATWNFEAWHSSVVEAPSADRIYCLESQQEMGSDRIEGRRETQVDTYLAAGWRLEDELVEDAPS